MTHKPGTVNVRIDSGTLRRIADKKAHLKLARQTASFPTIDEVINAALDALDGENITTCNGHNRIKTAVRQ